MGHYRRKTEIKNLWRKQAKCLQSDAATIKQTTSTENFNLKLVRCRNTRLLQMFDESSKALKDEGDEFFLPQIK